MKYIRYIVKNDEPLRIADDSTSQDGQTVTLRYIPGTTIRGYIVNQLVYTLGEQFDKYKRDLISGQIVYMNAYLYENNRELLPSPKGFYEDKTVVMMEIKERVWENSAILKISVFIIKM